jgi:hypothetical protein
VGENTDRVELEIMDARRQLGRNLGELEAKAHQLTDWRAHYRRNPGLLLGIAAGGGLVLGAMVGPRRSAHDDNSREGAARLPRPRGRASRQFEEMWQSISDALLGVASARVIEFISTAVPGFREQLSRRQSSTADGRSS